jgi:hypothetical protein
MTTSGVGLCETVEGGGRDLFDDDDLHADGMRLCL